MGTTNHRCTGCGALLEYAGSYQGSPYDCEECRRSAHRRAWDLRRALQKQKLEETLRDEYGLV